MKISTIKELLDAEVLCCEDSLSRHVYSACGCDLMSDVLAYVKDQAVLMTGLVNPQVIRTAVMMDMVCVVFVRSKEPTEEMLELAREHSDPEQLCAALMELALGREAADNVSVAAICY